MTRIDLVVRVDGSAIEEVVVVASALDTGFVYCAEIFAGEILARKGAGVTGCRNLVLGRALWIRIVDIDPSIDIVEIDPSIGCLGQRRNGRAIVPR